MMPDPQCELLPWDSDFFGLRIARAQGEQTDGARLAAIREWCAAHEVDCLYFLAALDDSATLAALCTPPFKMVDLRVTLACTLLSQPYAAPPTVLVRNWQPDDLPRLRAIARGAYTDSRFYFDGGFARPLCDKLYETWIEQSCRGQADFVLVAEHEGAAAAFVTGSVRGDEGQIGLVGVDVQVRGRGLGSATMGAALAEFRQHGCTRVEVVTQGRNLGAQRLYGRAGFVTQSIKVWFHGWFLRRSGAAKAKT